MRLNDSRKLDSNARIYLPKFRCTGPAVAVTAVTLSRSGAWVGEEKCTIDSAVSLCPVY